MSTDSSKLVSIIVPIYNGEKYLRQCIDSVLNQTYRNIEVILINDGSTDGTPLICDEYSDFDTRIKVIHQQNQGLVSSRKQGIMASKGEYIGFVDADDWIEPMMYEHLIGLALQHDVEMVTTGFYYEFEVESEQRYFGKEGRYSLDAVGEYCSYRHMYYFDMHSSSCLTPHVWSKLSKKSIVLQYYMPIPNEITIGEDACFTYGCVPFIKSFYVSNVPLYHYRQHKESMMNTVVDGYINSLSLLYKYLLEAFQNHTDKKVLINELDKYYSAIVLRTIVKVLPREIVDKFLMLHNFPIEAFIKGKKVIICGEKKIADSYFKQLSSTNNIEVLQVLDSQNLDEITEGYDYIIIAIQKESVAKDLTEHLTEKRGVPKGKIIWKTPKRISDMVIAGSYNHIIN